ncbi:MAG: glycosyltransferase family 4 protein [Proteobacteria bacterium]|nr:glycosyltransferase family 4 protein [Pseudomonadota bacterium]
MKVLHLVAGELNGGAARGAYWLHQALRDLGVDSTILTNARDNLGDESVISLTDSALGRLKLAILYRMGQAPLKLYRNRQALTFSTGIDGIDFTRHPAYVSADLVHLHWVSGLVSTRVLRKMKKPVVWTLRDMWPFTGGCHHSLECDRFTKDCGQCPQLGSTRERDLTRFILRHKQASLPEDIRIVGISRWMSECASKSAVFRARQVTTISNNIDTQLFSPLPKELARQALGLEEGQKIVLVGALHVASVYKGFDLFLEALASLAKENIHVVLFGNSGQGVPESLGVPSTSLGFLSDAIALRLAYSAADVFVAPSRVDAFGKTLVEAMSCGTPVVCFNATGPKDIVEHRACGYLAEPFNPLDLAQGIRWVLDQPTETYAELCRNARVRAQQCFDSRVIAKAYLALYRDALRGAEA